MIRVALYGLTGASASAIGFVLGMYATFPSDAAIAFISSQVDHRSQHEYALGAESLGPWWGTGLRFADLTLYTVKRARHAKDQPQTYDRSPLLHCDSLGVRLAPLSFLAGKQGYAFKAEMLDGALSGLYAFSADLVDLSLDIRDLDLTKLGAAGSEATVNLVGSLGGEADLHINLKEMKQSTGVLSLSIEGFGIGAGSKVSGFELPATKFATARVAFDVHDGKMTVTDGTFEGDVITATLSGDVTLNKKMGRSRAKLDIAFTLPEDIQKLADLSPMLKRSKDDEGKYHCSVGGMVSGPSFRCGKGTTPRIGRDGPGSGGLIGDGPTQDNSELSEEERRQRREDRIKERRERLKKRREDQGLTPLENNTRSSAPFEPEDDTLPPMDLPGPAGLNERFRDPEDLGQNLGQDQGDEPVNEQLDQGEEEP
ncbi:MAG: type II secretion system protein GspN [Myxococcales bacterium]|nr:type II secretion system protein GspN [Myxococcales bacterium]